MRTEGALLEQAVSVEGVREVRPDSMPTSSYVRFHIETSSAPPRRKQPSPFHPRVSKLGLAKILLAEAYEYGLRLRGREYREALLSRPCIYGVFGGRFGGFKPIKEKCTGCMRCVQEYPNVCRVDRNPEFFTFADSYWMPDHYIGTGTTPLAIVSYEASSGKIPIKGMGYKGPFAGPGWDSIWTDMSEIVRPTRDGVYGREFISTTVDLGRKPKYLDFTRRGVGKTSRILEIPIPMVFDYLPNNLNNESILSAIAAASRRVGTYFVARPEQADWIEDSRGENLIPLLEPKDVESHAELVADAPAVELTSSDPEGLIAVRDINDDVPIGVRLPIANQSPENVVRLAEEGLDFIHLIGNYHGQSLNGSPLHMKDLIRAVHRKLVQESLRDEITLVASGGIILAEHVPKAIICGADLVALDTTILMALQVELLTELRNADQARIRSERVPEKWGEQRLVNLLGSWHDQLIEILSAMGMRDVRRLRGDVGRAMFNEDLEKEAFSDIAHTS